MRITTKTKKEALKPTTVRLDAKTKAIARAEAKAVGLSLSEFLNGLIQAGLGQQKGSAEIEQAGQAAMLSAQLSVEVLAHVRTMLMASPGQKQQIEARRAKLYAEHFAEAEAESASDHVEQAQPDQQPRFDENGVREVRAHEL